jgi:DNA-binding transcriptional MerR regulator
MADEGFSTPEVAKIAKTTIGTLDTWHRMKFISPSIASTPGRGTSRRYTFRDVVAIRTALELRDAGISMPLLKRVVAYLRERKGLSTNEALASTSLVTDGHDVFEIEGDITISALRRAGQRVLFVVPLGEIVSEVQSEARAIRAAA